MNTRLIAAYALLLSAVLLIGGCETQNPIIARRMSALLQIGVPTNDNPVKGWKEIEHVDQAVIDNYQAFIKQLTDVYGPYGAGIVNELHIYEDGTGQHVVLIDVQPDFHQGFRYYLLYDKSNVRYKVLRVEYSYSRNPC